MCLCHTAVVILLLAGNFVFLSIEQNEKIMCIIIRYHVYFIVLLSDFVHCIYGRGFRRQFMVLNTCKYFTKYKKVFFKFILHSTKKKKRFHMCFTHHVFFNNNHTKNRCMHTTILHVKNILCSLHILK